MSKDKSDQIHEWFEKYDDEYIEFARIPAYARKHPRPDLCALLYLHDRFGGDRDAVVAAEHDEIWLDWGVKELAGMTEEDVIYLSRCGVRWDASVESLCMFV